MKKTSKQIVKKMLPTLTRQYSILTGRTATMAAQLEELKGQVTDIQKQLNILASHDSRIDNLRKLLEQVEHYQPVYGLPNIVASPARESQERCWAIEDKIAPVTGKRIIDFGSSLGYFCFYFADRGAIVEGWEENANNAEVAHAAQDINGIPASFKTKELNLTTIKTIEPGMYDTAFILSVFHHIIRFHGLDYTKKLVKEIVNRIPVMVVELARKGENEKLPWDESQPEGELEIFDLVKDRVTITKIGEFSNHLSNNKRPVYIIESKKLVKVGNKVFSYNETTNQAYKGSNVGRYGIGRRYYFGRDVVIKEYSLAKSSEQENTEQILNEITMMLSLKNRKVYHAPIMLGYDITGAEFIRVAYQKQRGKLLSDFGQPFSLKATTKLLIDITKTLADLEKIGIYHNDIRSWNIVANSKNMAWLIDYGHASSIDEDNNLIALLWIAYVLLTGNRESSEQHKTTLPPQRAFIGKGSVEDLYSAIKRSKKDLRFKSALQILAK